jgi:hypothetical protein
LYSTKKPSSKNVPAIGSGLVPYRSVLEAQRDYDRAKSNYLQSIIEALRATARLSRVDGTLLARNGLDWNAVEPFTQLTAPTVDLDSVSAK